MKRASLLLAVVGMVALPVRAEGISAAQTDIMKQLIATYAEKAKADIAKAKRKPTYADEFSAEAGRAIYLKSRTWDDNEVPACSGCHTDDPMKQGTHAVSKKPIKPLAPAANPERFVDAKKVERNFAKHCQELYNRDCSAAEKGNLLTYLMSVK